MDFQSKAGSTNIGGAFAAAQIAGFNDQVVKFSGTTTTFQPGYEGFQLSQLKFVMWTQEYLKNTLGQSLLLLLKVLV
jgi:hypothetical protein